MQISYTNDVKDSFLDLEDRDLLDIWQKIENTPEDETAAEWKKKLEQLAREYSFSSRFALMRIFYARANGSEPGTAAAAESFQVQGREKTYTFSGLSMEYAETLPRKELSQYEELLLETASSQEDSDEEENQYLIKKALKMKGKSSLSREEAFRLGHILDFSLQEMSWFLLRVFDFEAGFRFNVSNDLIEAYCFLTGGSGKTAERIKERYAQIRKEADSPQVDARPEDWTQKLGESLERQVQKWNVREETREDKFLQWLEVRAPYLDQPSRTAAAIYRNLAVYADRIGEGEIETPTISEFIDIVRDFCSGKNAGETVERLFEGGSISKGRCKKMSGRILKKNKELYTSASAMKKAWRTVTVTKTGIPRISTSGERMCGLLTGEILMEKGDMLHLLWYGFCLCWMKYPITEDASDLFNNLADFLDTARLVLDAALLPEFYPPHLMERSMLLAIVTSCMDGTGEPAFAYAEICESLIDSRSSEKN